MFVPISSDVRFHVCQRECKDHLVGELVEAKGSVDLARALGSRTLARDCLFEGLGHNWFLGPQGEITSGLCARKGRRN